MHQEMSQWVVLVKENNCRGFYSKTESLFDPLIVVGFSLQGRNLVQPLHRKNVSPKQKNTWTTHVTLTSHKGT